MCKSFVSMMGTLFNPIAGRSECYRVNILSKGNNFCDFVFASIQDEPFQKGSAQLSKEDGWMTCIFMPFSIVFQSYRDDCRMIMKGCEQWNLAVYRLRRFCLEQGLNLAQLDQ